VKSWARDCHVDTDFEVRLPDQYVANVSERIKLYRELDEISDNKELMLFEERLEDRFGPLPTQVKDLLEVVRVRMIAQRAGFEKIVIKNGKMLCWFISNKESSYYESGVFVKILQNLQANNTVAKIEEKNDRLRLVFSGINNISTAYEKLKKIM